MEAFNINILYATSFLPYFFQNNWGRVPRSATKSISLGWLNSTSVYYSTHLNWKKRKCQLLIMGIPLQKPLPYSVATILALRDENLQLRVWQEQRQVHMHSREDYRGGEGRHGKSHPQDKHIPFSSPAIVNLVIQWRADRTLSVHPAAVLCLKSSLMNNLCLCCAISVRNKFILMAFFRILAKYDILNKCVMVLCRHFFMSLLILVLI